MQYNVIAKSENSGPFQILQNWCSIMQWEECDVLLEGQRPKDSKWNPNTRMLKN